MKTYRYPIIEGIRFDEAGIVAKKLSEYYSMEEDELVESIGIDLNSSGECTIFATVKKEIEYDGFIDGYAHGIWSIIGSKYEQNM